MKKVLALVLAVIMVCTMAMAANVSVIVPGGGNAASTTPDTYAIEEPGTTLVVDLKDENGKNAFNFYFNSKGEFVPDKNTLTVTYEKGSEWVASAKWVKVNNSTDYSLTTTETTPSYWEYQITLKQDYTKAADNKVCDFSISKIALRADGYDTQNVFTATATDYYKLAIGYKTADLGVSIDADGNVSYTPNPLVDGTIYTVKTITNNTKPVNSATVALTYGAVGDGLTASTTLTVGQKFLFKEDNGNLFTAKDTGYDAADIVANGHARGFNEFNTAFKVVFNQGKDNADKVYNVYAKDLSGKITKLAATLDRGVLTFTLPALSYFIITTGTVTASATQASAGTNTTNPGTGANDVVGVAAALAVVALVSGAAISLKK